MSRSVVLFFFFINTALAQTSPKNYIAVLGGGGEPEGETTIFDNSIKNLGNYISNSEWTPTVSFNGGHKTTEELIQNGLGKKTQDVTRFTEEEYNRTITNYIQKIQNGEIKSGDQLMVWLDTHGAIASKNEVGHQVATTGKSLNDYTTLAGTNLVSTNKLQSLIDIANEKGIKLGILDFSCHSGASIALSNPKTCVISGSGPHHFAYSNFPAIFVNKMKPGKSLEEVFLDASMDRAAPSFPMISTEAGKKVQAALYELVGPYLKTYYNNSGIDVLTPYLQRQISTNSCSQEQEDLKKLMELTLDVEKVTSTQSGNRDYSRLRRSLKRYSDLMKEYRDALEGISQAESAQNSIYVCDSEQAPNSPTSLCLTYSYKELAMMNFDSEFDRLKEALNSTDEERKKFAQQEMAVLTKAKNKYQELLVNEPGLKTFNDFMRRNSTLETKSWNRATAVTDDLAELYQDMYQDASAASSAPNPCKDFKL